MFNDTHVLATAWLRQDQLDARRERTLLIGAALLFVRGRFGRILLDVQTHPTTVTDNPAETILWLGERLARPERLLLWRAEDIVVPSLIAAAETSADTVAAAKLLRGLDRAVQGEVIDLAAAHGGNRAASFDAVAHAKGLPFIPVGQRESADAFEAMNYGRIREHLAARVTTM